MSSLFPIKMIAKLEWTQRNAQQNIEQLQYPTMGVTINKETTTTEPQPRTDSSQSHWNKIFALDSAVVQAQKKFKFP